MSTINASAAGTVFNAGPSMPSTSRVQHLRSRRNSTSENGNSNDGGAGGGAGDGSSRRGSSAALSMSDDDTASEVDEENLLAFEVEPGIDVRRSDFSDLYDKPDLSITVADWCARKSKVRQNLDNDQFLSWLETPRPSWSKARWINLNGLNWDVFKAIALKYDLHPLAVEDCLHVFDSSARSKSDWYANHLFVRLVFWQLMHRDEVRRKRKAGYDGEGDDENVDRAQEHEELHHKTAKELDEEVMQRRRHAVFQKRVDKQGPNGTAAKQLRQALAPGPTGPAQGVATGAAAAAATAAAVPTAAPTPAPAPAPAPAPIPIAAPARKPAAAPPSFRVSKMTGRLSHSRPKHHSSDRVPTLHGHGHGHGHHHQPPQEHKLRRRSRRSRLSRKRSDRTHASSTGGSGSSAGEDGESDASSNRPAAGATASSGQPLVSARRGSRSSVRKGEGGGLLSVAWSRVSTTLGGRNSGDNSSDEEARPTSYGATGTLPNAAGRAHGRQGKQRRDTNDITAGEFESPGARVGYTTGDVEPNPFDDEAAGLLAHVDGRERDREDDEDGINGATSPPPPPYPASSSSSDSETDTDEEEDSYYASKKLIHEMTHQYRVAIRRQQLSLFLTKDGTLITIFSKDGSEITPSIVTRLKSKDTLLRNSEDASMLMQGVIDTVVDKNLDIVDAFRRKLDMLEGSTLIAPQIATVQHLHVMSQQLAHMRGTILPLQNLISTLRSGDEERMLVNMAASTRGPNPAPTSYAAALASASGNTGTNVPVPSSPLKPSSQMQSPVAPSFISPTTRVYLKDCLDHADSVLSSLELFMSSCDKLVDYVFNTTNFASNETMKILTYVSLLFLPLTALSGYYGMNFDVFPGVIDEGSNVSHFWWVALPMTIVICVLLGLPDIVRWCGIIIRKIQHSRYAKKRADRRKAAMLRYEKGRTKKTQ